MKAGEVAKLRGLPNERTAIEAVFRVYADAYAGGAAPVAPPRPAPVAAAHAPTALSHHTDAAGDLDDLLGGTAA